MRLVLTLAGALGLVLLLTWAASGPQADALFHWAAMQQRDVQNAMAGALRAIRSGDRLALAGLCGLSAAYGFLHAFGPGHGKILLGGAALAGAVPMRKMAAIGIAASLGQSVTAIAMVTVGAGIVAAAGGGEALAEGLLANASRWIVAAIGALIALRGARHLWQVRRAAAPVAIGSGLDGLAAAPARMDRHGTLAATTDLPFKARAFRHAAHAGAASGQTPGAHHDHHAAHDPACGCGHAHGPTVAEVAAVTSPREIAALILAIAIRPCTGALFLLAISFGLGIPLAGILATLAMGLGTAGFNLIAVAGGGFLGRLLRDRAPRSLGAGTALIGAGLQLAAGTVIVILTLGLMP
ncbi:nickel/cobalt transporter [Ponticoccus litoralis]|uniref:Nickel/cobalt efflux system n=1 Tax=Ponticoccus litoralis TaxID=422297 RepID=A0AAW9SNR2_9RHOB